MPCYFQLTFRTVMARIHHLNCPQFLGIINAKTFFFSPRYNPIKWDNLLLCSGIVIDKKS